MANKQHLHKLLSDAIPLLCRNGFPPSVTFRVEALIGITVIDDEGQDAVGEGSETILSFRHTVSENGVVSSQFGSSDTVAAAPDNGRSTTPRKASAKKQAPSATISVKQEYTMQTAVKQEYDGDMYQQQSSAANTLEEYGIGEEEVEYVGAEEDYVGDEEYYDEDGQYYDDGSGYLKYETADGAYMEDAGDETYMQTEYVAEQYPAGRAPKNKPAKSRSSSAGVQPGPSRARKGGGATCGGRAGKTAHDQATAIAVRSIHLFV